MENLHRSLLLLVFSPTCSSQRKRGAKSVDFGVVGLIAAIFGCRYPNDTYDGYETGQRGNPWVLCSAAMAELSYHAARAAAAAATTPSAPPVVITRLNQPFYANALAAAAQHGLALTHTAGVVKGELGELSSEASAELAKALVSNGDGIFRRVRFHTTGGELHQPEELNRDTGFEQGAGDLSWSYGGIMSALMARDNAVALL